MMNTSQAHKREHIKGEKYLILNNDIGAPYILLLEPIEEV